MFPIYDSMEYIMFGMQYQNFLPLRVESFPS